ncbi:MAG: acetyl-CoA C-acetyltransferase [Vicinamibacteria bacterium]|jgi:acetyl-CoA C-acetyltransferase|nr:acetyl-CoA C-acetyltransferase [Vicinamibacteria bacterium]
MGGREVVVAGAVRTPIGRYGGSLSGFSAADLGTLAAQAALERSGVAAASIDETLFGCARQAGGGPNPGRQIAVRAGVPVERPALTINMACASGLKTFDYAFRAIRDGEAEAVLVGGTEAMSRVPYLLMGARWGYRMGHQEAIDGMYQDGFLCPLAGQIMGETAETLADQYQISRDEQDAFALRSQQRAAAAHAEGRFSSQVAPVRLASKKGETLFATDEHARADTTIESLRKLPPHFRPGTGTVTAGNSSGITDGAAAAVLLSADRARELGVTPMARVLGFTAAGVDPKVMGIGVVPAVQALLAKLQMTLADFDLVELNEAFAAQALACDRELGFDPERLNVNGGAIALGHPIGATGARIAVTLVHEMQRRRARYGLATLCVSGGMGMAAAFERLGD